MRSGVLGWLIGGAICSEMAVGGYEEARVGLEAVRLLIPLAEAAHPTETVGSTKVMLQFLPNGEGRSAIVRWGLD